MSREPFLEGEETSSTRALPEGPNGVRVTVAVDPQVWLPGPWGGPQQPWLRQAHQALVTDFGLAAGSAEAAYVGEVLTAFAEADLGDLRFLRMRALADPPVAARVDLAPHEQGSDPLLVFDEDVEWYDHQPRVEVVDAESGLRRSSRLYVDDGVRAVVRHHRLVDGVDLVVSCAGYDLRTTAGALDHLADLLDAVRLTSEQQDAET